MSGERLVILCDKDGTPTGTSSVVAAHEGDGKLHKAFSIFVFRRTDSGRELLIQQRSSQKALFADLWANTCCSHPRDEEESICVAGERRLEEECGFQVPLQVAGEFVYRASDRRSGGTEYEHDTVLLGHAGPDIHCEADPLEIARLKWVTPDELQRALEQDNRDYVPWLRPALQIALDSLSDSHQ